MLLDLADGALGPVEFELYDGYLTLLTWGSTETR